MYEKIAGTADQKMQKAFGELLEPAKHEMNRFAKQEGYVKGLSDTYRLLIANTQTEIANLESSASKHLEMVINQKQLQELCEPENEGLAED